MFLFLVMPSCLELGALAVGLSRAASACWAAKERRQHAEDGEDTPCSNCVAGCGLADAARLRSNLSTAATAAAAIAPAFAFPLLFRLLGVGEMMIAYCMRTMLTSTH